MDSKLYCLTKNIEALEKRVSELELEVTYLKENSLKVNKKSLIHGFFRKIRNLFIRKCLGLKILLGKLDFQKKGLPRKIFIPHKYFTNPKLTSFPLITIVTPSFQQGKYLERTIKSVLDQKYPRLEYVVQDGGSTDTTAQVLDRYRNRLARAVMCRDNGQSHAINLGFQETNGEIMAYLNSDDMLLPGSLFAVVDFFNKHPDVDVVYGHRVVIDSDDNELGRWVIPPHDKDVLKYADFVPQETLFWKRRLWDKVGGIDESFRFAMDWDLLLRFQENNANIVRIPRFLGAFRIHSSSKTVSLISETGIKEMNKLRFRSLGKELSNHEINQAIKKYLRRHQILNRLYELGILRY